MATQEWLDGKITESWLPQRTILYTKHGSHAYGTNIETSDEDFKGICVPPQVYRDGFRKTFEQRELKNGIDAVIYDIRKFFRLGTKANPNILELLWVDESDVLICSSAGALLREHRHEFLSKKAFKAYSGYATSQINKMRTHRSNNPDRQKMFDKHGYDTKFAMHLIRLLRMCGEIFEHEELVVRRPDAKELLAIRNGAMAEPELIHEVLKLETRNKKLLDCSSLPEEPNYEKLDRLCVTAIQMTEKIHG